MTGKSENKGIKKTKESYMVATKIDRRRFDIIVPFIEYSSQEAALKDAMQVQELSTEMRRIRVTDEAIIVQERVHNENYNKKDENSERYVYIEKEFKFRDYQKDSCRSEALKDAKAFRDRMRFISEVPTGYIVRKTVIGKIYQTFFGTEAHGGRELALEAAMEYRDQIAETAQGYRLVMEENERNITGIAGLVWHCKPNKTRDNKLVHAFRGQAPDPEQEGSTLYKGLSVQRYGLWNAFYAIANWRLAIIGSEKQNDHHIYACFKRFLSHYIKDMEDCLPDEEGLQDSAKLEIVAEMKDALIGLASDPATPKEVVSLLPKDIRDRFDKASKRPSLNTSSVAA